MAAFECLLCNRTFTRNSSLLRHKREVHDNTAQFNCYICGVSFKRKDALISHQFKHTSVRPIETRPNGDANINASSNPFEDINHARYNNLRCFRLRGISEHEDLWLLYRAVQAHLRQILATNLEEMDVLKFNLILQVTFEKALEPDETISCYFHSNTTTLSNKTQGYRKVLKSFKQLNKKVEDYIERGSGWVVRSLDSLDVHVARCNPIRGRSYLPLPNRLQNKKAVINVLNKDDKCFMWSVLAALHPVNKDAQRVTKYTRYVNELNFEGIEFPVKVTDVPLFERLNDISINVYGYDSELTVHQISQYRSQRHISLLLLNEQHYCWIKDPERFFSTQRSHEHRLFQCHLCLCLFYTKDKKDRHMLNCENPDYQAVKMPIDNNWLYFTNYHKMLRQPYIIYADFECLLEKIQGCEPSPNRSSTTAYQKHVPCGYGLAEVYGCCYDKQQLGETYVYRGEEAVRKFLNHVIRLGERFQHKYDHQKPVNMTQQDLWHKATRCNICNELLNEDRVLDHCHLCGQYRGMAHAACNVNFRLTRDVIVVFHNLRRYDGHLILEQLGKLAHDKNIDIRAIPKGMDDFLTFTLRMPHKQTVWNLKFIDSFQFMATSLEKLVDNLRDKGEDKFIHTSKCFKPELLSHVLRKGVYPYDYMDTWAKFAETSLPSIDAFTSSLTGETISTAEYERAETVWAVFELNSLGDYHDLYLLTDVLLLADVFENFRNLCLYNYGLDPSHYYTSPSFSWDACLKHTNIELELLIDPDMYKFFEDGIRGGVAQISHRFAQANNKYLEKFDPTQPTSYLIYQDMNNLYGWSMTEPLPVAEFRWLENVNTFDVMNVPDDNDTGYVLEVELEYPEHLHTSHNDFPLAVEKYTVSNENLSPYCQQLKSSLGIKKADCEKLVPNLCNKQCYKVHYRNLKLYLSKGLKLTKIHRILAFKQSRWMEPYIQFNTEMRKKAANKFEQDLFKLFNNSVFGKTMENVRNYKEIKLVSDEEKAMKLTCKSTYSGFAQLADNLWAIKLKRDTVELCKPIYVGFTVLDLSKWLMYDYHYNYMVRKYGERANLLMTDTDSLIYRVFTDDIYADMREDSEMFDFSEYPTDHPCYNVENKKVIGKMKDELKGVPLLEFVGLRAKMYSLLDERGKEIKRAKGVRRHVVAKQIKHDLYRKVLFDGSEMKHSMRGIHSDCDTITSVVQNKTSLSCYDDKRYLLDDGVSSVAYGHCCLNQ